MAQRLTQPAGEAVTREQVETFRSDGFLVIERDFLDHSDVDSIRDRFTRVFEGEYETGIQPDEVKWVAGRDPEDTTRQVCNTWKADRTLASHLLSARTGRLVASLMGWDGVRVLQDVCIWKPPAAPPHPMHRDGARLGYLVPSQSVTCWIALDATARDAGAITYARGSHHWPEATSPAAAHGEDWLAPAKATLPDGLELDLVPAEVEAGGAIFHRYDTFHGYGPNNLDVATRGIITHFARTDTRFDQTIVNAVYSKYRRVGDLSLDESFFPIVWTQDGKRSSWLDEFSNPA